MKQEMREDRTGHDSSAAARKQAEEEAAEPIRITDRRRIHLDNADDVAHELEETTGPSLKPTYVEELEARTRAAEQKVADVQHRFEQLRAEMQRETDATRTRLNRAADERARQEKANFIRTLLPVMDNLQLALNAASTDNGSLETLLEGLRGTVNGFEKTLAAAGVERIESIGAQFDPELHEAVEIVGVEPERDGVVTAEFGSGYKIDDRLLRPARVQVGRNKNVS
jgi:molecular chaperone GrpE